MVFKHLGCYTSSTRGRPLPPGRARATVVRGATAGAAGGGMRSGVAGMTAAVGPRLWQWGHGGATEG
jgi:hypothetical protein